VTSKMSWGPNLLIKQGAKLVQEWNDVVAELPAEDRRLLVEQRRKALIQQEKNAGESEAPVATSHSAGINGAILRILKYDTPMVLDSILESLEYTSPSEAMAALFELEMTGAVRQMPGKSYIKVWEE